MKKHVTFQEQQERGTAAAIKLGWIIWIILYLLLNFAPDWLPASTEKTWNDTGTDYHIGSTFFGFIFPLYFVGWLFFNWVYFMEKR